MYSEGKYNPPSDKVVASPGPSPIVRRAPLYAPNGLKMLHENLCIAQTAVSRYGGFRDAEVVNTLQNLINQIEVYRPLGSDGKHKDLHTPYCGCDD